MFTFLQKTNTLNKNKIGKSLENVPNMKKYISLYNFNLQVWVSAISLLFYT